MFDVATGATVQSLDTPGHTAEMVFTRDGKHLRAVLADTNRQPAVASWDTEEWKRSDLRLEMRTGPLWQLSPALETL